MKKRCLSVLAVVVFVSCAAVTLSRAAAPPPPGGPLKALSTALADTVQKVMPSVVVIRTERIDYYLARDPWAGRIYQVPEKLAGQGSGIIISKDGHVLTSNHVVDEAQQIEVVLHDGTKYPAKLIGQAPQTDLAVLKIAAKDPTVFTAIEPGDSDALRVGELVLAIGSPFSLGSSVTAGIVSQKERAVGLLPYEDFIQTDAAVNPGNSGGPLVDVDGRMVGMTALIQTAGLSQGNIGIGFAVPSNLALDVAKALIKNGKWERPWVGIAMNHAPAGVVVEQLIENSPAAKSGLKTGDVIVAVDGQAVKTARDVQKKIMRHAVGDTVAFTVKRKDKEMTVEVSTVALPEQPLAIRQ